MEKFKSYIQSVHSGEVDVVEQTHKAIEELKKINSEYHYLTIISEELALKQAQAIKRSPHGKLAGVFISVKDSIIVEGVESRGGSKILSGYKPPFNSTVVKKCEDEGAIIIGKTSQDEFGFGGFSKNVGLGFKTPLNPFDKERACGGSSGGSGGLAQKFSLPHVSLGESTGGSIVAPASFCNVYGLCPTYGRVSRYGLLDYGNSLDKVGPMSNNLYAAALVQDIISGHDPKDSTSINIGHTHCAKAAEQNDAKGMKFAILKEGFGDATDKKVKDAINHSIKKLEDKGAEFEEISLNLPIKYGIPTYYLIATSEASTNLAKYCGMRYGQEEALSGSFNEYFSKVRGDNFGEEAKRRIMLGTFARMAGYRDAYYIKALKVRTLITQEYKKIFQKYDAIISPTMPVLPPRFDELKKLTPLQNYMMDVLTVGPNLAGLPHMNMPVGLKEGLPVGMMITADHLQEEKLIRIAKALEK